MVTFVPTDPDDGEILVMRGAFTVKFTFCTLLVPLTATLTCPLVAPGGTVATIWVSDQLTTEAVVGLKPTQPPPWVPPKPPPFIRTCTPPAPPPPHTPLTPPFTPSHNPF